MHLLSSFLGLNVLITTPVGVLVLGFGTKRWHWLIMDISDQLMDSELEIQT